MENFLLNTIPGNLIIGVLSAFIFWIILKVIGISNKKIKSLRIFYKEGNELISAEMFFNDSYLEKMKFQCIIYFFIMLIVLCSSVLVAQFTFILNHFLITISTTIIQTFIFIYFLITIRIIFLILKVYNYRTLIEKKKNKHYNVSNYKKIIEELNNTKEEKILDRL